MRYFAKALKQAWRHWPALIGAVVCSMAVAALWGANIAAIFPIIETTLHGESIQTWNQKRITVAEKSVAARDAQIKDLQLQKAANKDASKDADLTFQLDMAQ